MAFAGWARALALLSALIAVGQWVVFVPLLAMGSFDAGTVYVALLIAAFVGWPVLSIAGIAAAVLVDRRPRAAAVLLLIVGLGLLYPFLVGGLVGLAGAALAFQSRRAVEAAPQRGGWIKAKEVSRAVVIGVVAVVAIAFLIPTVLSLAIYFRSSDGEPATAEQIEAGVPTSADEALRVYAEGWETPFLGDCSTSSGESGTCTRSLEKLDDGRFIYHLCAITIDACVDVEVAEKDGHWAVTYASEPGKEP